MSAAQCHCRKLNTIPFCAKTSTALLVRSFLELNPQGIFIPGKYIELLTSRLQRVPRRKAQAIHSQPATAHTEVPRCQRRVASLVAWPRPIEANHLCQLRTGPGRQTCQGLPNLDDE